MVTTDRNPRCWNCNHIYAYVVTRPYRLQCKHCKAEIVAVARTEQSAVVTVVTPLDSDREARLA